MLIKEGTARSQSVDLRLAAILSFVAGALNAAGFEVAGVFSANMTGNISAMADNLAHGAVGVAALFGLVVVLFVGGAFAAGLAIEVGRSRSMGNIYALVILTEGGVLAGVGAVDLLGLHSFEDMGIIFVLGFVLGMQNATTTRISQARVRTTHVSGMATDLGLALAAVLTHQRNGLQCRQQMALHSSTILAFLLGGVTGATVLSGFGTVTFFLSGVVLMTISGGELLRHSRRGGFP